MFLKSYSFVCFNDDNTDDNKDGTDDNTGDGTGDNTGDNTGNNDDKTFTQAQVNTFLANEKRKTQDAQKQLAAELEKVKKSSKLTKEERDALSKQIDELQNKYMTAEEKARQNEEKANKAHGKALKELEEDRDNWKNRFTSTSIDIAITRAAEINEAIASEQIAALLRPNTSLKEKLDEDGKPSGILEPRVRFSDTDKEDKPIILDLTVPEAVKRMTELDQYGNLFKGGKTGGLGTEGGTSHTGKIDIVEIAKTDTKKYRKLRKEKPELLENL